MNKKVFAILCILVLLSFGSKGKAYEDLDSLSEKSFAILEADDGTTIELEIKEEKNNINLLNKENYDGLFQKEFYVDILPEQLALLSSRQDEKWDSTMGVKAWVKVNYSYNSGSMYATSVEYNWLVNDRTFSLSNATIRAVSNGTSRQYGYVNDQNRSWTTTPVKGIKYTGFTKPVQENLLGVIVAGSSNVTINRNTSSWTLFLNVIVNQGA